MESVITESLHLLPFITPHLFSFYSQGPAEYITHFPWGCGAAGEGSAPPYREGAGGRAGAGAGAVGVQGGRQGRISEHASSLEALALFCLGNIIGWDYQHHSPPY